MAKESAGFGYSGTQKELGLPLSLQVRAEIWERFSGSKMDEALMVHPLADGHKGRFPSAP